MTRRTWIIDLDGVIWTGSRAIPRSAEAVQELRERGDRVIFVTNHSFPTKDELLAQLASIDIPSTCHDVRTPCDALAQMIGPNERVLSLGGPGVQEALHRRNITVVESPPADVVVVGWSPHFDFERLALAVRAVLGGARLLATNKDRLRPGEDGLLPGAGSLVAAVETATSRRATTIGKPNEPIAATLRPFLDEDVIVVGDSRATDGGLARVLGARFALVESGLPAGSAAPPVDVDLVAPNLMAVVDLITP